MSTDSGAGPAPPGSTPFATIPPASEVVAPWRLARGEAVLPLLALALFGLIFVVSPLADIGVLQRPLLGVAAAAWDEHGEPVIGELGELVVTEPMPSMPLRFWNDPDDVRYREAYFEPWPGVWRHGDWLEITDRGTCVITGRSDATLNL